VVEFAGRLDRKRLGELLARRGVDPAVYLLTGGRSPCWLD
jgi:hypothetical protein